MGYGTFNAALRDPTYWLQNLLCIVACMVPVVAMYAYRFNYHPEAIDHLQYLVYLVYSFNVSLHCDVASLMHTICIMFCLVSRMAVINYQRYVMVY
jgi:hypothetical protein